MIDSAATFYVPTANELDVFETAVEAHLPVMLLGPTGCGKTRLVEHMASRLGRALRVVVGNDDTSTADLIGRYLVKGGDVEWQDGPVTSAVRRGEMCYLDEVVEVRREALAAIHPLADHRRHLHIDRLNESVAANDDFALVCSYNPQRAVGFRDLRPAFRQRFVTIAIDYLPLEQEAQVVAQETGVANDVAMRLARIGATLRAAAGEDNRAEPPSTRLLVYAGHLLARGIDEQAAAEAAIIGPIASGYDSSHIAGLRALLAAF